MKSKYNVVTNKIIDELIEIAGQENVIYDQDKMENYSHDETDASKYGSMPEVVVTPKTTEQVSKIVCLANRELIPITPRGAGSGLSGGAIPLFGGILLSMEKMNNIIEIDSENMTVTAEAGIITNEMVGILKEHDLFYAGYPMSLETCFLGGNIAENAGGGKAVKYGVTGDYVLGIELVTPEGDIVTLGGKLTKDVTGYNLKQLIIGSEGTLGIVTKAIIKLKALPKVKSDLLILYKTTQDAIDVVPKILHRGIVPTGIEYMDKLSVHTACEYLNENLPYKESGAMLLVEVDGFEAEQVESEAEMIGELCLENGAIEVYVADNYTTQERIWSVRRSIAEAFKAYCPKQCLEDIVVPISNIPEMVKRIEKLSEKHTIKIPCYGHAGDGNLHATLIKDPQITDEEWDHIEESVLTDLYREVSELSGKISGEHGIGLKRKKFLQMLCSQEEMKIMKAIKQALDPNNIMNPGKIFD